MNRGAALARGFDFFSRFPREHFRVLLIHRVNGDTRELDACSAGEGAVQVKWPLVGILAFRPSGESVNPKYRDWRMSEHDIVLEQDRRARRRAVELDTVGNVSQWQHSETRGPR